jgi:hypothetical protein
MGGGWSEDCKRRSGSAVAEEAAGVVDQEQVAAQRESVEHSFT